MGSEYKELVKYRHTRRLSVWQNRMSAFDWKKFEFDSSSREKSDERDSMLEYQLVVNRDSMDLGAEVCGKLS
jgi:hypothetical protein